MNEIKLTTELCAEDRARLDKLLEALCSIPNAINTAGTPYSIGVDLANGQDFVEIPEPAEEKNSDQVPWDVRDLKEEDTDQAPVEKVAEPQHTKTELQQKVVSLVSAGKKAEVKEVIQKYAPKVSEVPEDKVNEVWGLLSKLEG